MAVRIPVPPAPEQVVIIEWIKDNTDELTTAINKAKREIDLIREYRTRLITDLVTGKLDVRHLGSDIDEELAEAEDLHEDIDDEELPENGESELDEEVVDAND